MGKLAGAGRRKAFLATTVVTSSLSEGRQRRAGSLERDLATEGDDALKKVSSSMVGSARAISLVAGECGGAARLLVEVAGKATRGRGEMSRLSGATFREAGTRTMLPTWHWNGMFQTINQRRLTKAKANREQAGPEQNRQDRSWMRGKATQGKGGESNRVELREQKGNRKESGQAKEPGQQQREKLGERLRPCRPGGVGDIPGVVVKEEGISLGLVILGLATSVALGAMGGGPTAAGGTPVPGATFLLLRLGLGGIRRNGLPGSVGLGSPLLTRVAALTGGTSTAVLSRFLGLRAAASHVALLATVVAGNGGLVQAGRNKVVGLCGSKMSEVAGGGLGVGIVTGWRPLAQVQLTAILIRGCFANIVVGEMCASNLSCLLRWS